MHLGIKNLMGGALRYIFGDGVYSQNIIQGGSTLQPQASYNFYGPDLAPTATLSQVGTTNGGYVRGYLVDGNNSTGAGLSGADTNNRYIFDYGTAKRIRRVVTSCNFGSTSVTNRLAYSDDGTNWTTVQDITTPLGSSFTTTDIADVGEHRYWSLSFIANALQYTTVQMHEYHTLTDCIVITGAATVAPDGTTGASAFSCKNLVIDGASASLTSSTNSKGLIGLVSGKAFWLNGAKTHMDKLGKAGNFGNLTVFNLTPTSMNSKLKNNLAAHIVLGEGAAGASSAAGTKTGLPGAAAGAMRTGGGGTGSIGSSGTRAGTNVGGKGGPCCGGAGAGGGTWEGSIYMGDGGDYGGPGGGGNGWNTSMTGGAGDPLGGSTAGYYPEGAGGGLLFLACPAIFIAAGCIVSADGARGGIATTSHAGGSAGGGCVVLVTLPGGYTNLGTVRAAGGAGVNGAGAGGAGSVNILTVS